MKSRSQTLLAATASMSSLTVIVFLGLTQAHADASKEESAARLDAQMEQLEEVEPSDTTSHAKPSPAGLDAEPESGPESEPGPSPALEAERAPAAALVTVPEVAGVRVWIARKRLKDAGLVLAPRYGSRKVPTSDYSELQVADDTTFEAQVPRGSLVEVQVEYYGGFLSGY